MSHYIWYNEIKLYEGLEYCTNIGIISGRLPYIIITSEQAVLLKLKYPLIFIGNF